MSLYADKDALEEKMYILNSQISGVVNDICCKKNTSVVNTFKLNLGLLKATIYMLYNNSCTEF
jgi:hypothetical protein